MLKINARDCIVIELDQPTCDSFLKANHNQGTARSSIRYGLYFDDELVQIMTFGKPRFNNNYQWEIIRECTKKGVSVRGGTSKLWKHFLANNTCRSCICYSYPHNGEYTNHYVDYCGFRNVKSYKEDGEQIYYTGTHNGTEREYSIGTLKKYGVDRLLGTDIGFENGTNEEILLNLGFKKIVKNVGSPQVDAYYPFSIVYRVDDLTDGSFYIGMCESEHSWNNGYLGSGNRWVAHLNRHPNVLSEPNNPESHEYKRVILKSNFNTPKDTRNYELECLEPYTFINENGVKIIDKKTGCRNLHYRTQNDPYIVNKTCDKCGGRVGHHKISCSKSKYNEPKICDECGSSPKQHKKWCSRYVEPKPCLECGRKYGHKNNCSKAKRCEECNKANGHHEKWCSKHKDYKKPEPCEECGATKGHKKGCSKFRIKTVCSECGGLRGNHKNFCSKSKPLNVCKECGGKRVHKKGCSKYRTNEPCEECGAKRGHKRNCSKYRNDKICEECGGKHGIHKKYCTRRKEDQSCEECGGIRVHKKTCSKYRRSICEECGSVGPHKKGCSKSNRKTCTCKECGGAGGKHMATCSKYKKPTPCPECGTLYSHKKHCSQARKCAECGSVNGHKKGCSFYKEKNVCEECGSSPHKKSCSKYKIPKSCKECGAKIGHKKNCRKYYKNKRIS